MTDAEIEARATAVADIFLENAVMSEVSAEARAEFIGKIGDAFKSGVSAIAATVVPAIAAIIGFKIAGPWVC